MTVHNLGAPPSISSQFLSELRDPLRQTDRLRFRHNLALLGTIMGYEISKTLPHKTETIKTGLGDKIMQIPVGEVVLLTILRAGLPFMDGFQRIFSQADVGFIGAYRVEGKAELTIEAGYIAAPQLDGKSVILVDTMLATGKSLTETLRLIKNYGEPEHLHLASVIAAPEGIRHLTESISQPASIWTFAIDEKLNEDYYIVPGLGDAGDLSFGPK